MAAELGASLRSGTVGRSLGGELSAIDGPSDGRADMSGEGIEVGSGDGRGLGSAVGWDDGSGDGNADGAEEMDGAKDTDGAAEELGKPDGANERDGPEDGDRDGSDEGAAVVVGAREGGMVEIAVAVGDPVVELRAFGTVEVRFAVGGGAIGISFADGEGVPLPRAEGAGETSQLSSSSSSENCARAGPAGERRAA